MTDTVWAPKDYGGWEDIGKHHMLWTAWKTAAFWMIANIQFLKRCYWKGTHSISKSWRLCRQLIGQCVLEESLRFVNVTGWTKKLNFGYSPRDPWRFWNNLHLLSSVMFMDFWKMDTYCFQCSGGPNKLVDRWIKKHWWDNLNLAIVDSVCCPFPLFFLDHFYLKLFQVDSSLFHVVVLFFFFFF